MFYLIENPKAFRRNHNVPTVDVFYKKLIKTLEQKKIRYILMPTRLFNTVAKLIIPLNISFIRLIAYHTSSKNYINVKIGYLPNIFYLDSSGYSGWSEIANFEVPTAELTREKKRKLNDFQHYVRVNKTTKYQQNQKYVEQDVVQYCVVFGQVAGDRVQSLARFSLVDMLLVAIQFAKMKGISVIYKKHPLQDVELREVETLLEKHPEVIVSEQHVSELIKNCYCCFVCNSGTGFEALLQMKPVVTFGKSDYEAVCYSWNTFSKYSDLIDFVDRYESNGNIAKVQNFLYKYLFEWMVNIDDWDDRKIIKKISIKKENTTKVFR
jgi:hypothetical protein